MKTQLSSKLLGQVVTLSFCFLMVSCQEDEIGKTSGSSRICAAQCAEDKLFVDNAEQIDGPQDQLLEGSGEQNEEVNNGQTVENSNNETQENENNTQSQGPAQMASSSGEDEGQNSSSSQQQNSQTQAGNQQSSNSSEPEQNSSMALVCHRASDRFFEININENAVEAHLAHGDYLGECSHSNAVVEPVNLVVNGSFEQGHDLSQNSWNVFSFIPGWRADLSYTDAPIEIQRGARIGGVAPVDGDSKLELDSHNRNGFSASDAKVVQDIQTQIGKTYILSFYYSPRNSNIMSNIANVFVNDETVMTLSRPNRGFEQYTFEFTAIAPTTSIAFAAIADSDTIGAYIDHVKVVEK